MKYSQQTKYFLPILLFFFVALIFHYGDLNGQVNQVPLESGNRNAIFLVIIFSFLTFAILILNKLIILRIPYIKLIILFILNILLVSLLRENIFGSLRQAVGIVLSLCIIIQISLLMHSIPLKFDILIIILIIFFAAIISIYVHITKVGPLKLFEHSIYDRLGGLFYYAHFAMLMAISGLLSIIFLMLYRNSIFRSIVAFNLIFTITFILFTDTRSVIASYGLCVAFVLLLNWKRINLGFRIFIFIAVLILLGFMIFYFFDFISDASINPDFNYRIRIWGVAIRGILEKPFVGYGKNSYLLTSSDANYLSPSLNDPHNAYLHHALNYGLFSLIILLTIILKVFIDLLKDKNFMFASICLLWITVSFFWGHLFNINGGFIQFIIMISILGICSHPSILGQKRKINGK